MSSEELFLQQTNAWKHYFFFTATKHRFKRRKRAFENVSSPWRVHVDAVSGRRHQPRRRLSAEQHQQTSAPLGGRASAPAALSGRRAALAARQLHAALLLNLQHLQHQHARPVHWRADQQQHRCLVCIRVCFSVRMRKCTGALTDPFSLRDSLCARRVIGFFAIRTAQL